MNTDLPKHGSTQTKSHLPLSFNVESELGDPCFSVKICGYF